MSPAVAIIVAAFALCGTLSGIIFTFVTAKRVNETARQANQTNERKVDTEEFTAFTEAQDRMMERMRTEHEKCEKQLATVRGQLQDVWKVVTTQEEEIAKCHRRCRELETKFGDGKTDVPGS